MPPEQGDRCDIAIIGGGLVGASLALALRAGAAERGWRVVLIESVAPEADYQPSYDARSSAISYGSRGIYQSLGLWPSIARRAEPIREIQVSERGRFGVTRLGANAEGVPAFGYVVDNAWLGHCLNGALDEGLIERRCPAAVSALQPLSDGYRLQFQGGGQLRCALAVLADGGRSGLARTLGIGQRREPYEQSAIIANLEISQPHQGCAFERFSEDGPLAFLPLVGERCALVWTRPQAQAERLLEATPGEFLTELQRAFGYRLGRLSHLGQRYLYPLALVQAEEQVRPHLALLGNAAHGLHPVAGQGFNLSLRDVQAMAQALLASREPPGDLGVLQNYLERRRRDQWRVLNFSHALPRLFGRQEPGWRLGRNLGLLALDLMPTAKHWFARQAMGVQ